jgi:hypothetical protein
MGSSAPSRLRLASRRGTLTEYVAHLYGYHMSSDSTIKTTVYLDAHVYKRLKSIARANGRTAADMVREAVAQYAARQTVATRPSSVGAGRSGRSDVSERAEELLNGMGDDA